MTRKISRLDFLYGATIDQGRRLVSANLALSDSGYHYGILEQLRQRDLLVERDNLSGFAVRDTDNNSHKYHVFSWQNKAPDHSDFAAEGIFETENEPDKPHLALAAKLGAKGLLLATRDFYKLTDNMTKTWSSDDFSIIPPDRLNKSLR